MKNRLELLQKRAAECRADKILIESPVDLFYLTGLPLSRGRLLAGQDKTRLFVDGRYLEMAKTRAPCEVFPWEAAKEEMAGLVGFDSAYTTVDAWEKMREGFPKVSWIFLPRVLRPFRLIKDADELQKMRKAAKITWAGVQKVQECFREGVSEKELALEFEILVRRMGASKLSFDPIIAFGKNGAYPHHRSSDATLQAGESVLIDVGAVYENYAADVTRTVCFGKMNPQIEALYKLVRQAAKAAKEKAVPGTPIGALDEAARKVFRKAGVEDLYVHNLGHGIGLETHEYPSIRWDGEDKDLVLKPGMVFTIEPGLYQPGLGGIRHENTGVLTEKGFESFYPED